MTWYIYKIQNKINDKIYIGQAVNVPQRWGSHKSSARKIAQGKKQLGDNGIQTIHCALAKYGIDNFEFKIIEEVETRKEANDRETYWVSHYDSYHNGYNNTLGGYNVPKTEEWKDKVRATRIANDSYGHSEETKQYLSDKWHEHHPPESIEKVADANRGRKLSDEQKQFLSELHKGNQYCLGHKQPQEVIEKRIETRAANYGSKVCSAPNCTRTDGHRFADNGLRYCNKHLIRMQKHGQLNPVRPPPPNKGKKMSIEQRRKLSLAKKGKQKGADNPFFGKNHSEETIEHLRKINQGKEPPNKIKLSKEQIDLILSGEISERKLVPILGVSRRVIRRIKEEHSAITHS